MKSRLMIMLSILLLLSGLHSFQISIKGNMQVAFAQNGEEKLFLPLTFKNPYPGRISGNIAENGLPAGAAYVRLYKDGPEGYQFVSETFTFADGFYDFYEVPPLDVGEEYEVSFLNAFPAQPGRLLNYYAPRITSLASNQQVLIPTFDVADVVLAAPSNSTVVSLPTTFQWQTRPNSSSDTYVLAIFCAWDNGTQEESQLYDTSGYEGSYEVTNIPDGFYEVDADCFWGVDVKSLDGGYGAGAESRSVSFLR